MSNEIDYLSFEKPIAEIEAKILALKHVSDGTDLNISEEILALKKKNAELTKKIFSKLTPAQIVQVARHPNRPHFLDYQRALFPDFIELHGDREFTDGRVIIGGITSVNGRPIMLIGQEKGRETNEKIKHNFGMPRPADYRKAKRLMQFAEKFNLPVITLIDTPGAYPGIDAEENNQSGAIADCIYLMSKLRTPIVSLVIGEGGSGGALAIGVADRILMLQYSIYSVISPEGCATILWKNAEKADEAAAALGITAEKLTELKLIDGIINEPMGGAHRDYNSCMHNVRNILFESLAKLEQIPLDELMQQRYNKLMLRAQ